MSLKNILVVGFDLDGTLYPSTPKIQKRIRGKIYEKIAASCKIPIERARNLFEENYSQLMSGSRTVEKIAQEYGVELNGSDIIQDSLQEADFLDLIEKNPKLNKMLIRLREIKRKSLDLLTGSNYSFTLRKLEKLGINPRVFDYILADEDGSKSFGEIYKAWIARRDFHSKDLLYVGDNTKQDIDIPKSFGIKTCIVGEYDKAEFQINNILDLENLLS